MALFYEEVMAELSVHGLGALTEHLNMGVTLEDHYPGVFY